MTQSDSAPFCPACLRTFGDDDGRARLPCAHVLCITCAVEMFRECPVAFDGGQVECKTPYDPLVDVVVVQQEGSAEGELKCVAHAGQSVSGYCPVCRSMVCPQCAVGHVCASAFLSVARGIAHVVGEAEADVRRLGEAVIRAADAVLDADARIHRMHEHLGDSLVAIDALFDAAVARLNARRDALRQQVKTEVMADEKTMQDVRDRLIMNQEHLVAVRRAAADLKGAVDGNASSERTRSSPATLSNTVRQARQIQARVDTLLRQEHYEDNVVATALVVLPKVHELGIDSIGEVRPHAAFINVPLAVNAFFASRPTTSSISSAVQANLQTFFPSATLASSTSVFNNSNWIKPSKSPPYNHPLAIGAGGGGGGGGGGDDNDIAVKFSSINIGGTVGGGMVAGGHGGGGRTSTKLRRPLIKK